jgi:hypothetical protein
MFDWSQSGTRRAIFQPTFDNFLRSTCSNSSFTFTALAFIP